MTPQDSFSGVLTKDDAGSERLLAILKSEEHRRPNGGRWWIIALSTLALALSSLGLRSVEKIHVELDLRLSALRLRPTDTVSLWRAGSVDLQSVRLTGFALQTHGPCRLAAQQKGLAGNNFKLKALSSASSLTLDVGLIPATSTITIEAIKFDPHQYSIEIDLPNSKEGILVLIHGRGRVEMRMTPGLLECDFGDGGTLEMQARRPGKVHLALRVAEVGKPIHILERRLATIRDLIEPHESLPDSSTAQRSAITGGEVRFPDIPDRKHVLLPGDVLRFEKLSGAARLVAIDPEGVHLVFSGVTSRLELDGKDSVGGRTRSLMPSLLELYRARDPLMLAWAFFVYLVVLAVSVVGWWRKT